MKLLISKSADKILSKQTSKIKKLIEDKLIKLQNAYPDTQGFDITKLKGTEDVYRLRIGAIRILIKIIPEDEALFVFKIGFRGDVYKY